MDAIEQLRRSTVQVLAGRSGSGSGVVLSGDGRIVTNAHVVGKNERVQVRLWNGRSAEARVTHRHASRDLALVQAPVSDWPAAVLGSSAWLRPGAFVMAVGNPLGFVGALSTGVVYSAGEWIQASVRLAPGNSGGPLADAEGRVVGINTMVARGGLGFAIPSEVVSAFLSKPRTPVLGISVHPTREGLVVLRVDPDSAAARASLLVGDILVNFQSPEDLRRRIENAVGSLLVEFRRGGKPNVRTVMVPFDDASPGRRPAAAA